MANIKKFETDKEYIKEEKDKKGKVTSLKKISVYNGITFDEICDWLEENGSEEDKKAFKIALYSKKDGSPMPKIKDKDGIERQKTNFINAKREFFKRHNPEYLPKKKDEEPKKLKSERIANW